MSGEAVSTEVRAAIEARLSGLAAREGVRVLLSVESGSRAWGFHSADSDYDVRFIYARPVDAYLALWPPRDVIEEPLEGEIDLGGWDLPKALRLLAKGNAVLAEWVASPIRYGAVPGFAEDLAALIARAANPRAWTWHYLSLARASTERLTLCADTATVRGKRYFYVLRPALALRWLRRDGGGRPPPMDLPGLIAGTDLDAEAREAIAALLAAKRAGTELGAIPRVPAIEALCAAEIEAARASVEGQGAPDLEALRPAFDALFRRWIGA